MKATKQTRLTQTGAKQDGRQPKGIAQRMVDGSLHRQFQSERLAQLQAHAQGRHMCLGPEREQHLPQEASHVVQQKLGRAKPKIQMKEINNDAGLEKTADVMEVRNGRPAIIQRKAWTATRPLGQQSGDTGNDLGLGLNCKLLGLRNLGFWHRHIIFDHPRNDLPVAEATNNIGYHGKEGKSFGAGELFSEKVDEYGYSKEQDLSFSSADDDHLANAIRCIGLNNFSNYNVLVNNCQRWVSSVVEKYRKSKRRI